MRRTKKYLTIALVLVTLGNFSLIHVNLSTSFDPSISRRHVLEESKEFRVSAQRFDLGERIDWNNYTLMQNDRLRTGPGEQGKPVFLQHSEKNRRISESLYKKHKFNVTVSEMISYQRSIGDLRDDMCKRALFTKNIPLNSISIIIPFHNEHNSTIFRTIHSIITRTPIDLLKEIILVDDCSTIPDLKRPLENYLLLNNLNKIKVIRNNRRLGLILSRIVGAGVSTGRFLVFLDAHVEVNYNFLPPLIEPIILDPKTITCPVVDIIDRHDFRISKINYERNAFRWDMRNQHFQIFPEDRKNLPAPIRTPTMLGCAFAIDRSWWETLGEYDRQLEVWGGEQYELSFKAWMCGGKIVNIPCSRVAHLFRNELPYSVGEAYARNIKRVALVWMDEYKEYVYQRLPGVRDADAGDITSQLDLRRRLQCKDFRWYMTYIAPDVVYNWPLVEPSPLAWGSLRPRLRRDYCLKFTPIDQKYDRVFIDKCRAGDAHFTFEYSWRGTITEQNNNRCLETKTRTQNSLSVHRFRLNATEQQFVWDRETGWIVSLTTGYCLHHSRETMKIDMKPCRLKGSFYWLFEYYNATLVDSQWGETKDKVMNRYIYKAA